MTGREKCEILRDMRRKIAEANGIVYLTSECTFQGDCLGFCPKCDAESKYLDSELNRIAKSGQKIRIAGISYQDFLTALEDKLQDNNDPDTGSDAEMGQIAYIDNWGNDEGFF